MNNELFESLLFEEESTTLDFKKEQYRFVKSTDDEKSELLKDLVGFANAWRRSKAYILIGVQEVRGAESVVVGIQQSEQLDDHSLQQFVNSLLNTPIHFQYRAYSYRDKQVGVFVLDEDQQRPVYLKRNYGKLEKEKVYIRRGSSTDPSKPATIEEIARMGAGRPRERATVVVEFAEVERDDAVGTKLPLTCELCSVPERKDIPKLGDPRAHPFGIVTDYNRTHNGNYHRELANYEVMTRLFREVRVVVRNTGEVAASNVRVELTFPANAGMIPVLGLPNKPREFHELGAAYSSRLRPLNSKSPGDVNLDQNEERFRIDIDVGDLQPGRRVWSDTFFLGAGRPGEHPIRGEVFADNLPAPQEFTLTVTANVEHTALTLAELQEM
jgi:hypothetical protein